MLFCLKYGHQHLLMDAARASSISGLCQKDPWKKSIQISVSNSLYLFILTSLIFIDWNFRTYRKSFVGSKMVGKKVTMKCHTPSHAFQADLCTCAPALLQMPLLAYLEDQWIHLNCQPQVAKLWYFGAVILCFSLGEGHSNTKASSHIVRACCKNQAVRLTHVQRSNHHNCMN